MLKDSRAAECDFVKVTLRAARLFLFGPSYAWSTRKGGDIMKRFDPSFTAVVVIAGAFFCFGGCAEVQKPGLDAGFYTKRGVEFQLNGQCEEAMSDFNRAIEKDPKHVEAYFNRGLAYAQGEDQDDQAISDFNKVIELDPKHASAYNNRGLLHMNSRRYDQAISDFDTAIGITPKSFIAHYNRGIVYQYKGQYDRAIADYSAAIEINPGHAMAYNNRGSAFHHKGEYGQAISDYNKAVEIDPEYALAYFNRGISHFKKGDYEKAWEDVLRVQMLGYSVSPEFLEQLHNAFEEKI